MSFKSNYLNRHGMALVMFLLILMSACNLPRHDKRDDNERLKVLFLGDDRGHKPSERLRDVARPMLDRGIELFYTSDIDELNLENLRRYDVLMLYANYHQPDYPELPQDKEDALISYVEEGGGFVAIHSASGNFRNSERYIELLGGAFASHGTGTFITDIAEPEHEIMKGFEGFESWDETYVHQKHNEENRTVLSYRDGEPWTWVRRQGKGRVFYTAWGHDERTWRNTGFHELLERGIRWAAGQKVQQTLASRTIDNPFKYDVLDVPFPPPHEVRVEYEKNVGPMDRGSNYPKYYKQQKALSPGESMERMILPAGFRVELFASEPDVVNPIAMNWDEQGRLWVVESIEYPYPREFWPDGGGKDRIRILEDTDGDGKADKVTEFADNLNIPTALTFADGGVIVHQAPQTLFLKDTDGDGKADVRKVLFEGWSQHDTHAGPSHLHYGLDNQIWGVVGYSGFDGTVGGKEHEFRMGVYRFKKDGSKLEFLRRTNNNTWGLGFNEQGKAFISTANGNPSTYLPFPRNLYEYLPDLNDSVTDRLAGTARIITLTNLFRQVDWVGAYTSGAGHALYTARNYPEEYWNRRAFVADPTMQMVGEFILSEKGSGYEAQYPRNLIASDDEWFSPVVADIGPDGNVWIADWYNYIIQHNAESDRQEPTPGNAYANPLRDRQHGRIYRIVYEEGTEKKNFSLKGAGAGKLVEALSHDNMLWRKHAQRLLVERGQPDVAPALIDLVNNQGVDETGMNTAAIHGLWTLHGLGQLTGQNKEALSAAVSALGHPSPGVRLNAVKVLPEDLSSVDAIIEYNLLRDTSMQVRLETLVTLAGMPASDGAGRAIFELLNDPSNLEDRWIREAAALAASIHHRGFLSAADAAGMLEHADTQESGEPGLTIENIVGMVYKEHPDALTQGSNIVKISTSAVDVDAILEVGVVPNILEFDKKELRVKAGQTIQLTFKNTGNMEHNLLFIRPGTVQRVGSLADQMISSSEGRERHYAPESPDVLAHTPILQPGESYDLIINIPSEPGEYTFVCTIPGHWRSMQGTLVVEP